MATSSSLFDLCITKKCLSLHIGQCNNYLTYLNVVINDIILIIVAARLSLKQHVSCRSWCSLIGYKVTYLAVYLHVTWSHTGTTG